MKFLIDQDVYASTVRLLMQLGHDVITAAQGGLSHADDEVLLKVAQKQGRILITRDRDFGGLVFMKSLGAGVIYLRILPAMQNSVHQELEKVLKSYSQEELAKAFVVIEPAGHRFRRLQLLDLD